MKESKKKLNARTKYLIYCIKVTSNASFPIHTISHAKAVKYLLIVCNYYLDNLVVVDKVKYPKNHVNRPKEEIRFNKLLF